MPKKEPIKSRIWERERRDRLKICFQALSRVLPSYDPSIVLSKLEILQRAKTYIEDLQTRNKEISDGGVVAEKCQINQIQNLQKRITYLLNRTEELTNLLNEAGIHIPIKYVSKFPSVPRLWTNKITKAKSAEILSKLNNENKVKCNENEAVSSVKLKNKTCKLTTPSKTKTTPKSTLIKVKRTLRVVSDNKFVKKKKSKTKNIVHVLNSSSIKTIMAHHSNNIYTVLPTSSVVPLPVVSKITSNCKFPIISVTHSSIVTANSWNTKSGLVTNSKFLSQPLMATGISPTNHTLNTIGPSALIFSNGTIMPILPPQSTVIQQQPAILTAVVNPTPPIKSTILVLQDSTPKLKPNNTFVTNPTTIKSVQKTDQKPVKTFPKIVPKIGITKTTTVNKVPIPALLPKFTTKIILKKDKKKINLVVEKLKSKSNTQTSSDGSNNASVSSEKNETSTEVNDVNKNSLNSEKIDDTKENDNNKQSNTNSQQTVATKDGDTIIKNNKCTVQEENSKKIVLIEKADHLSHKLPVSNYSIDSLCKTSKELTLDKNINNSNIDTDKSANTKVINTTNTETDKQKIENFVCDKLLDETINKKSLSSEANSMPVSSTDNLLKQSESIQQHSELSNDIFASLHVPNGSHHPESVSPTAAFLLAFPLVSTGIGGKITEAIEDDNSDSPQGTPTLLQIGNIESVKTSQMENLTPNLLTLDNFTNLFSQKDTQTNQFMINDSFPNMSQKFNTNIISTKNCDNNNKFLDFENHDIKYIPYSQKETNKDLITKDKMYLDIDTFSNNCLFSDIRVSQNNNTAGNIFNYEHIPVTHTIAAVRTTDNSVNCSNKTYTSNGYIRDSTICNENKQKIKINTSTLATDSQTTYQTITSVPNISLSNTINNYHHSNEIKSSLAKTNDKISQKIESNFIQNSHKDLHEPLNTIHYNMPSNSCQTSSYNNNQKLSAIPFSYSVSNYNYTSSKSTHSSSLNLSNMTDTLKTDNNIKVNKTETLPSCQNLYELDAFSFNSPQTKLLDNKTYNKHLPQTSYYNINNSLSTVYNTSEKHLPESKSSSAITLNQKPPVNWMTTPEIKIPTSDYNIFTPIGRGTDYSQSNFYTTNNQSPSFFNMCNNSYQNTDNSHNTNTKNMLDQPFNVISQTNYSQSSNILPEENQFSWSPSKVPPLIENSHNLLLPSTLPTLIGDLALNTNIGYRRSEPKSFNTNIESSNKNICLAQKNKHKSKDIYNNSQQNVSTNFLSVSQLVDHNKTEMDATGTIKKMPNQIRKINSNQKIPKQISKENDVHNINNNNTISTSIQSHISHSHHNVPSIESTNKMIQENWMKAGKSTKNNYKHSSNSYSAEALIGHNIRNDNQTSNKNKSRYSSSQPLKNFTQIGGDNITYYSSFDIQNASDVHYYSQAHNNVLTNTTASSVYHSNNIVSNTPTITSSYMITSGIVPDIEPNFNNFNYSQPSSNCKQNTCSRTGAPIQNKIDRVSNEKKNNNQHCTVEPSKRTCNKRKYSSNNDTTNNTNSSALVDINFLSLPNTVNSPLLTEDPFHVHTNFLLQNPSQVYPPNAQNSLYPKSLQTNQEYTSPAIISLSSNKSNLPTQYSSSIGNTTGSSLTNFNLSTIFPEINKTNMMSSTHINNETRINYVPGSVSNDTLTNNNYSVLMPPAASIQNNLKPSYGPFNTFTKSSRAVTNIHNLNSIKN